MRAPIFSRGRALSWPTLLLACLCAACDQGPAPGTAAGQLATLYSDSTRWCKKQRECKTDAQRCAARWPDRATARHVVGKLPEEQVQGCLKATLALDACALKLPCDEFAVFFEIDYCERGGKLQPCCFDGSGAETPCPDVKCAEEELRFVEQCDPLEQLIGD